MPCRHMGEQRCSSTHFHLSISWSSQLCASAALPVQKTSPVLVEYGAGWAQELVQTFCRRAKPASSRIWTMSSQFSSLQFSHFSNRAVLETFCPKRFLPLPNQPQSKQVETLSGKIKSFFGTFGRKSYKIACYFHLACSYVYMKWCESCWTVPWNSVLRVLPKIFRFC